MGVEIGQAEREVCGRQAAIVEVAPVEAIQRTALGGAVEKVKNLLP